MPTDPTPPFAKVKPRNGDEVQTLAAVADMLARTGPLGPQYDGGACGRAFGQWLYNVRRGNLQGVQENSNQAKLEARPHPHAAGLTAIITIVDEYVDALVNPREAEVRAIVSKLQEMGFDLKLHRTDADLGTTPGTLPPL